MLAHASIRGRLEDSVIVCPRCGKENQDHYKFCLGCGAELPRDQAQPKSFTAPTPPAGMPAQPAPPAAAQPPVQQAPAQQPPAQQPPPQQAPPQQPAQPAQEPPAQFGGAAASAPADDGPLTCPQCSSSVPRNFKFCGSCGYDMTNVQGSSAGAPQQAAPAAQQPAQAAPVASGAQRGTLVLIRPDGTEGESFPLSDTTTVGREAAGPFASDSYLSPQHAEFRFEGNALSVTDLDSLNGVYLRIARDTPTEVADGAIFRIGQEILRMEYLGKPPAGPDGTEPMGSPNPGYVARIRLVIGRETHGNSYCVPAGGLHLGRERGDVIFPEDGYVSGLHCRLHMDGGKMFITDVGSSNGTFVRVDKQAPVPSGSLLLMGQQLFRAEY